MRRVNENRPEVIIIIIFLNGILLGFHCDASLWERKPNNNTCYGGAHQ